MLLDLSVPTPCALDLCHSFPRAAARGAGCPFCPFRPSPGCQARDQSWSDQVGHGQGDQRNPELLTPEQLSIHQDLLAFCLSKESKQLLWNSSSVKKKESWKVALSYKVYFTIHRLSLHLNTSFSETPDLTLSFEKVSYCMWHRLVCAGVCPQLDRPKLSELGLPFAWLMLESLGSC